MHEGANDGDFLAVAVREGANVAGEVALKPVGQSLDFRPGNAALEASDVEEELLAGETVVESGVCGEVAYASAYLQGICLGVESEDAGGAAGGAYEVQE